MRDSKIRPFLFLITYSIILYFIVKNINGILAVTLNFIGILAPFIIGLLITYIVNWPYVFCYDNIYKGLDSIYNGKFQKLRKTLSLLTSYLFIFSIIVFLICIIVPQLVLSVNQIIENMNVYLSMLKESSLGFLNSGLISESIINMLKSSLTDFIKNLGQITTNVFPHVFNATRSFTVVIYDWLIGIIVSIYLLSNKEKLLNQVKKLLYVIVPDKYINKVLEISKLTCNTFGKYITGQLLDAIIIGVLCFIGMTVLGMPYPVLISVIVGVTNIIPFFGPFIGGIPSFLIILMINPIKAIWFAVFIFILQQIDGNVISPKIIGNSVGISGVFVMFSVIVGGGLFGVIGMVLGVPLFAVIYVIIRDMVNKRLENKSID